MKIKTVKRMLCLLLAVVLLTSGISVFADDGISPYYTGTATISASLSISTSGKATCTGKIHLYSSYTATLTVKLQRYENGYWSTVKSWSTSDSTSLSKSYYVTSGYSYRVVTSASVYNSSGKYVEGPSATSATKSY